MDEIFVSLKVVSVCKLKPFGHQASVLFVVLLISFQLSHKLKPFGHHAAVLFVKFLSSAVSFSQQLLWLNVKLRGSC